VSVLVDQAAVLSIRLPVDQRFAFLRSDSQVLRSGVPAASHSLISVTGQVTTPGVDSVPVHLASCDSVTNSPEEPLAAATSYQFHTSWHVYLEPGEAGVQSLVEQLSQASQLFAPNGFRDQVRAKLGQA